MRRQTWACTCLLCRANNAMVQTCVSLVNGGGLTIKIIMLIYCSKHPFNLVICWPYSHLQNWGYQPKHLEPPYYFLHNVFSVAHYNCDELPFLLKQQLNSRKIIGSRVIVSILQQTIIGHINKIYCVQCGYASETSCVISCISFKLLTHSRRMMPNVNDCRYTQHATKLLHGQHFGSEAIFLATFY